MESKESKNSGSTDKSDQDDVFVENGISKKVDKNNAKGKKRRKCLRDKTAPRPPHSGYIRFLNDRRDQFRSENPNLPFAEITKELAAEWNQLPADKKQHYLSAAEQERVKYVEELAAYRKTDAYKNFIQRKMKKNKVNTQIQEDQEFKKEKSSVDTKLKKDQESKKEKSSGDTKLKKDQELVKVKSSNDNINTVYDIPIFTDEFLNFSKGRDSDLRYLRKTVTDQEQEVAVLDKHIENMKNGIVKLEANTEKLQAGCSKYEEHLIKLRPLLLNAFAGISFPDNIEPPTNETIDTFMVNLATTLTTATGTDTDPSWIEEVKKAISNLDFS
ncbi:high mobility group protein 20A-like isoform X1 [Aphis gossypii]|uniref:high mobility group protein 20A-like isoform X1 n=1 Tax=Aphis gossypii TaxID=80765 RepID=UPI002159976F|nr:high mobility group protein 20A-like isoform X1 [Aphis gossypii]